MTSYAGPRDGLPDQSEYHTGRAVFTESYAVIPAAVMTDIVTSSLPGWDKTRVWVIARPLSGFAETFAEYVMEIAPGGGSDSPEPEAEAEGVLFVTRGTLSLTLTDGTVHTMAEGGYAYLPPGCAWSLRATGSTPARLIWVRKLYQRVPGIIPAEAFVTNEQDHAPAPMPGTDGRWATTRFVSSDDMRHDMQVNIVTLEPGAVIPFEETHVMEHGLYVLEGKGVYKLNRDWVEVGPGDFMWLRAFCPQACYAGGPTRFRYLLYKDMNRHVPLRGMLGR